MGKWRPATDYLWDPYPVRPSGSARWDTVPMTDEEKAEAGKREKERKARGFGFAPTPEKDRPLHGYLYPGAIVGLTMPLLWEGDDG